MVASASCTLLSAVQAYSLSDIASCTLRLLGDWSLVKQAMQISRSVIIPFTLLLLSTTGMDPQSQSHINLAATLRLSSSLQLTALLVIKSATRIPLPSSPEPRSQYGIEPAGDKHGSRSRNECVSDEGCSYGAVILSVPVWHEVALQPAAGVVIMGASPLALRRRVDAPVQVSDVVPLGATTQKLP